METKQTEPETKVETVDAIKDKVNFHHSELKNLKQGVPRGQCAK